MRKLALVFVLALVAAGVFASSASALRFETGDCYESGPGGAWICPTGFSGASYSAQLKGAGGCGPALPYQWSVLSGSLPPGISLATSGALSGTPTTPGTYLAYIELSDEDPPTQSWCVPAKSQRQIQITILQGLSLDTTTVPPGTLNTPYSTTLTATPAGTQSWSVTSGALPPGLTLGATSGVVSGTPTTVGSFPFAVTVTDSEKRTARREYRIDVRDAVKIAPLGKQGDEGGFPSSEVGVPFAGELTATGGTGSFTWSLAGGALPAGLTLGPDGKLTGTPTSPGRFAFTVQVTDTEKRIQTLPVSLTVAPRLLIKTLALKVAKEGRAYRSVLATIGGVHPVSWRLVSGKLPRGVRLSRELGVFAGIPVRVFVGKSKSARVAKFRVTIEVVDELGVSSTKTLTLFVRR